MAHNADIQKNAARIVEWLLDNRSEFEQNGIDESRVPAAIGLSEAEATRAIDHLEGHEDVARLPEELSNPPKFLLKPARGWPEIVSNASDRKTSANV
ncbi:MAG TPA: hypothetical protein VKN18_22785 [Blastocatellia bacterium]|nr:hypothetical protein [Blastocatellia bacterium]